MDGRVTIICPEHHSEPYGKHAAMFGDIISSCVMLGKILSVTEALQEQKFCRP